jgi:Flp pilus assembly protein TadG
VCLPLLLLLFFAAFEFCRANMLRQTAENAAYEGARRAIVPGATADDARNFANAMLALLGTNGASVDVEPEVIEDETPEVTVTVTVPLNGNGFVAPLFLQGREIVSTMTLAREQNEQTSVP